MEPQLHLLLLNATLEEAIWGWLAAIVMAAMGNT